MPRLWRPVLSDGEVLMQIELGNVHWGLLQTQKESGHSPEGSGTEYSRGRLDAAEEIGRLLITVRAFLGVDLKK